MWPVWNSRSVPRMPTRSTSTTTSPGSARGASTSCTEPSPGAVITKARIRADPLKSVLTCRLIDEDVMA